MPTRSRIFDPFFTTKEKKGTGWTRMSYMELSNHITVLFEVESEKDRGTFPYIPPSQKHASSMTVNYGIDEGKKYSRV